MKTKTILLANSFHNRSIRVRATSAALLTRYSSDLSKVERRTVKRIRDRLCGSPTCQCGVVR